MPLITEKLDRSYEPTTVTVDPVRTKAYAAATNDDNEAYTSGRLAPPVFAVVPAWDAMLGVVGDVVPPDALMMIVHGEQDMFFHRPLVPGRALRTTASTHSARVGNSGTRLVIRLASDDAETGEAVVEQYVTMFIRGMTDGEAFGPDKPDHTFPEAARAHEVGRWTVHVDLDQTYRYRDASGDQMPIHVDDAFAKAVGLPGIIAHGLCTMAMTSQAVIRTVAGGDPARLRRLAVRFAKNVFPGDDVTTTIYDGGSSDGRHRYPFEAATASATVIVNGLAEVDELVTAP